MSVVFIGLGLFWRLANGIILFVDRLSVAKTSACSILLGWKERSFLDLGGVFIDG
jgi:hypothetical protein